MAAKSMDKEAKRHQLLEAALVVFNRHGYDRATISSIALEAGVGKGTVYEYFESKGALFEAVFEYHTLQFVEHAASAVDSSLESDVQLRALIDSFLATTSETEHMQAWVDFWARSLVDDELDVRDGLRRVYATFRQGMVSILENGQKMGSFGVFDPVPVAAIIAAVLEGLFFHSLIARDLLPMNDIRERLHQMVAKTVAL